MKAKNRDNTYDYITISKDNTVLSFSGEVFDVYKLRKPQKAYDEVVINPSTHEVTHVLHDDEIIDFKALYDAKEDYFIDLFHTSYMDVDFVFDYFDYIYENCPERFAKKIGVYIDVLDEKNNKWINIESSILLGFAIFNLPENHLAKIIELFTDKDIKNMIFEFNQTISSAEFNSIKDLNNILYERIKKYESFLQKTNLFVDLNSSIELHKENDSKNKI